MNTVELAGEWSRTRTGRPIKTTLKLVLNPKPSPKWSSKRGNIYEVAQEPFFSRTHSVGFTDEFLQLGPNVSVGRHAVIGAGSRVKESIVLVASRIGDHALVLHCIVGSNRYVAFLLWWSGWYRFGFLWAARLSRSKSSTMFYTNAHKDWRFAVASKVRSAVGRASRAHRAIPIRTNPSPRWRTRRSSTTPAAWTRPSPS